VELERLGEQLRRIPALAVDAALTAAVAVANGFAIAAESEAGSKSPDALAYLLGVAIAAPLLVRRRWPLGMLLVSAVLLTAYHALDYPAIGLAVPLGVALFTAVLAGHLWEAATASLGLVLLGIGFRALEEGESLVSVVGSGTVDDVALLVATMALAEMVRTRRAWLAEVHERLRRTEADREREAQRRVEQERLRIAQELHDVLAHTIAVIGVQAGVATEALTDSPADAQASLLAIRERTREALSELRATVGVLRERREGAPRSPAPRLAQLEELVGMAADAGVQVDVSVTGSARSLPAIVELAAYRIIQESLTNVIRHAGARRATVSIGYEPDAVMVRVDDDGRGSANGAAAVAEGHGLVGMRERAGAIGGRFEAGPAPTRAEASASEPGFRPSRGRHDDPGAAGRRPDARALRLPRAARARGGDRGGG
jgi:signal transduction histidine kinase